MSQHASATVNRRNLIDSVLIRSRFTILKYTLLWAKVKFSDRGAMTLKHRGVTQHREHSAVEPCRPDWGAAEKADYAEFAASNVKQVIWNLFQGAFYREKSASPYKGLLVQLVLLH